jgi:4-amino-4-deoxy-L-arabinose transferase-like glycosyltransferase
MFFGWVAWACFVLAHYYVQLLRAVWTLGVPSGRAAIAAALPLLLLGGGILFIRGVASSRAFASVPHAAPFQPWTGRVAAATVVCSAALTVPWLLMWPRLAGAVSHLAVPGLPWIGEAAGRAAIAVTGATLVGAATVSAGAMVLRILKCRFTSRTEHVLFAAVSGVAVIAYSSFLLAVFRIYHPISVALLISAALAAGVPGACRIAERAVPLPTCRRRRALPWLALIVVGLGYGLVAALSPEKEYDALWYHLNLPRIWLDAGHPVDLIEEYISLYPLTWELMFAAGMTLGGVVGAKLLHFACLPLLGLVVWHTARRFFPGVSAAAAVAFVVTTPTVLWESSTAYIDLALALHAAAACYALARYAEQGERAWGGVAALQFGLAAATKHLGVIMAIVALALYVFWGSRVRHSMRQALGRALVIGLVAAVVPSPWYVRSWIASGNPVFPEMFGVFGASPPERWDAATEQSLDKFKARFGMGRTPGDLATLPWDVTVHGASFGGALGPVFLVLIPGLLCVRRLRRGVPWLAAGIVSYVAVWASPISSYQLRFLVPIVPALALLAAASLSGLTVRAAESMRLGPPILAAAVLILGVTNLPPFTRFHEADRRGWSGWLTHVLRDSPLRVVVGRESEAAYLAREVPSFGVWRWINTHLPADVRVLATVGGDHLYADRARIPYDATIARPAVWVGAHEIDNAAAAQRRLGITHVLFDRRELSRLSPDSSVLASPAFQQACATEYADGRFWLCRIDYSRLSPPHAPLH